MCRENDVYNGMSMLKTDQTTTIDECIASLPKETQEILQKIRAIGRKIVPESTEAVSYGMPTLKLNGKNFFHFCGFKNHIGVYPAINEEDAKIPELKQYRTGKGTFQFPLDQPIPYDLIEKMITYRATLVR
jgi:uncharacterized protein YdhG (YjbR/CyaY superfamily)